MFDVIFTAAAARGAMPWWVPSDAVCRGIVLTLGAVAAAVYRVWASAHPKQQRSSRETWIVRGVLLGALACLGGYALWVLAHPRFTPPS